MGKNILQLLNLYNMLIYSGIVMMVCMLVTQYFAYKNDIHNEIFWAMASLVSAIMFAIDIYLSVH